jgi:hypothetical protein
MSSDSVEQVATDNGASGRLWGTDGPNWLMLHEVSVGDVDQSPVKVSLTKPHPTTGVLLR